MQHGASKKKGKVLVQEHVPKVKASFHGISLFKYSVLWNVDLTRDLDLDLDPITLMPLQDFYAKECWAHHPKPYADFEEAKVKERETLEAERKRAIRF